MYTSVRQKAFPGAQIVVLKDGKEILNKNYGYHTYDSIHMVTKNSIYDLASITKPTAGAFALMSLYEDGLLDINSPLSNYIKYFKNTRVGDTKVIDYLQHISGIRSWIPFHETTKKDNGDFLKALADSEKELRELWDYVVAMHYKLEADSTYCPFEFGVRPKQLLESDEADENGIVKL